MRREKKNLQQRVLEAAERNLKKHGSVGVLDVFVDVGFLHPVHLEGWQKALPSYPVLDRWILCGDAKQKQAVEHFLAWVRQEGLEPFEIAYERRTREGTVPLRLTEDENPELEELYRTKFRRPGMSEAQRLRTEKKAQKQPDLVVYIQTGRESNCAECDASLEGAFLYLEAGQALCMDCADMAHLIFLPSGDATLTRRARKHSSLAAVVVEFNRRRKRYERRGILVTQEALDQAEASCEADADVRAVQRKKAAERRGQADVKLVEEMTMLILDMFPGCPPEEANQIAGQTCERGSGRVGRSAAGRALSADAIRLAVRAWIRHQHTNYDELLMSGVERLTARKQIADALDAKVLAWRAP